MIDEASPHWAERWSLPTRRPADGPHSCFPAREGFPQSRYTDGAAVLFEIVTVRGQRFRALVDASREYSSEGLQWEAILPGGRRQYFPEEAVACWRRVQGQE